MLDIEVLDHLVIGRQRYASLKERGWGSQRAGILATALEASPR